MLKFLIKLLIFSSPIIVWMLVVNFLMPIDYYYFRSWEALSLKKLTGIWSGPFYPNQYLEKIEKGDLGPHTEYAIDHKAIWQTDKYGMRNTTLKNGYDIVVMGDSTAIGAGLSQSETLTSRIEFFSGLNVYAYTAGSIQSFLADQRFGSKKPRIIVMSGMERMLPGMEGVGDLSRVETVKISLLDRIKDNYFFSKVAIFVDRPMDPTLIKFIKFKLTGQKTHFYTYVYDKILFIDGGSANNPVAEDKIDQTIEVLSNYSKQLENMGYRFIFVPVPNKENIYYQMMPGKNKPIFLQKLIDGLKKADVEVVDTQALFDNEFMRHGPDMYHKDDTHWNVVGVNLVASEIAKMLKK